MKKYFLAYSFIVLFIAVSNAWSQDDTRAVQTWQVQKYDLSVTLPQAETDRSISSKATITIKNVSGKMASSLTLRISSLATVSAVTINGSTADFSKSEEKVGSAGALQRIAMRMGGIAPEATVTAVVDYKLLVKDNSGLNTLSPVGSQFLPLSFWYPTPTSWFFNRGADFAPFSLKVSGGQGQTVVSSGASVSGGFEQKYSAQPFFASGNWDLITSNGVDVYVQKGVVDGQKRAAELAAIFSEARTFAAGIMGADPGSPLRIVATRRGAGFAGSGTVFVDEAVFRRAKVDSQTAMALAEGAAKIWVGSSVRATGEGQGAILEGLPRFIATEFLESKYGKDVADVERMRHRTAYAAVSKRDAPLVQVSPLDDYYYGEVANKGSMIWRLIYRNLGKSEFSRNIRENSVDGSLSISELRSAFVAEKDLLDYLFDKTTDMNLLAGLPLAAGGESKVALRNTGPIDANVTVVATLSNGQKMEATAVIKPLSFGEVSFKTPNKVVRVEVDADKLYPQTEYSDDVAPRETTDTDLLLAVKRNFDKQDYTAAENTARTILASMPRNDDVRILLARSLAAVGKTTEAEREFRAVLDEKLPSSRGLAWANVGLAEIAAKSGQNDQAAKFADAAIAADAEYGASLLARNLRNKIGVVTAGDPSAKSFLADFAKAIVSNRKAEVDALVLPGEVVKFASGLSGSTEQWQGNLRQVDRLDANNILIEADITLKLLTRDPSSGMGVFRLTRVGSGWKLSSVDMFEVK